MSSNDQTVSFSDLWRRHRAMQDQTWEQMCARLDEEEPSLVGYSMAAACRIADFVSCQGVSKEVSDKVMREIAKSMLMVVEATLDGQRRLWVDLLPNGGGAEVQHG